MRDLYVSQPVLVTQTGEGLEQLKTPSPAGFKHDALLTDRKVLKTISKSASYGLASLNRLKQIQKLQTLENPYRRGLFSAAPAPYTTDKESYFVPARDSATSDTPLQSFGKLFDHAQPTTGIMGLPNGVTCFAANLLQSLGPHGTYVSRDCSVHAGIAAGKQHWSLGRLDDFIVFGFAHSSEKYSLESLSAHAQENPDILLPKTFLLGGFASYLSGSLGDFTSPAMAKILNTGPTSKLKPSKRPDIVIISTLSRKAKTEAARLFDGVPLVDYYSQYPYLAELSGIVEIAHAKTLSAAGEIPKNSLGIIICTDIFGQSSYLEFELLPEYEC